MSIHLFLSDKVFFDPSLTFVNLEELNLSVGFLDRVLIEHFVEPSELTDTRTERLAITYREETVGDHTIEVLENTITDIHAQGLAHVYLNNDETVTVAMYPGSELVVMNGEVMPVGPTILPRKYSQWLTLDSTKLSTAEDHILNNLSQLESNNLFNIIEFLTYGLISTDTQSSINTALLSSASFTGYIASSISMSMEFTLVYVHELNIHRLSPRMVTFKYAAGATTLDIVLWLDRDKFRTEYPHSTVLRIIPPFELATLLNPASMINPIEAAVLSRTTSTAGLTPEISLRDQTGMRAFQTRYVYENTNYTLEFDLVFRGRTPDDLECRNLLVDYLLASGVGTQALWEVRFPDLFIKSVFFIVPFYDNLSTIQNTDIYPSIFDVNEYITKFNLITANIPRKKANQFEMITVAWDRIFCGVCVDEINEIFSLVEAHPTYRDFSATDVGFTEMSSTDRDWSTKFNQALAKAAGENNSIAVSLITVGGLEWINLVLEQTAYNIITKTSYLEAII